MNPTSPTTNDADLDRDVRRAPVVLLKFTGTWCPPCVAVQPALDAIARENPSVLVLSIDADDNPKSALRFGVRSLPTILAFRDGELAGRAVGNQRKERLVAQLFGDPPR